MSGTRLRTTPPGSLFSDVLKALGKGRATAIQNAIENEPPAHKLAEEVAAGKKPFDDAIDAIHTLRSLIRDVAPTLRERHEDCIAEGKENCAYARLVSEIDRV